MVIGEDEEDVWGAGGLRGGLSGNQERSRVEGREGFASIHD